MDLDPENLHDMYRRGTRWPKPHEAYSKIIQKPSQYLPFKASGLESYLTLPSNA